MEAVLLIIDRIAQGSEVLLAYPKNEKNTHISFFSKVHFDLQQEQGRPQTPTSFNIKHEQISTDQRFLEYEYSFLAELFSVQDSLCNQILDFSVENHRFISYPCALKNISIANPQSSRADQENPIMTTNIEKLRMFNIVFAVEIDMKQETIQILSDILLCIAKAIVFEENRCAYFSKQIQNFEESDLDKALKLLFNQLSTQKHSRFKMNEWIVLDFQLEISPKEKLRPNQILLPLKQTQKILEKLPAQVTPLLKQLIQKNGKSLKDLQQDLCVS